MPTVSPPTPIEVPAVTPGRADAPRASPQPSIYGGTLGPAGTLYFLHIPKTAGTSYRTYLEDHFDADAICPHLVVEDLLPRPPSELERYRLISGHHGWFLPGLLRAEPMIVTVLRDPVARSLSHFYHQRNTKGDWLHEIVRDWTFEQYVTSPIGMSELANFQVRHLALDRLQEDYWDHSELRDRDHEALMVKYSDPRLLDRAMERTERFAVVGIQERFDETLRLTAHTLGWPPRSAPPRLNPRRTERDEGDLTDRALEQLHRITAMDRALYERAAAGFAARVAGLDEGAVERRYTGAAAALPRVSSVRYGFDRAIMGEGWHVRSSGAEGPVTRWTGPTAHATIDLPLARDRDLRIAFNAGVWVAELRPTLRLSVNGVVVPLSFSQLRYGDLGQGVFSGVIPRAVLARNEAFTRLRFEVARTVRPSDLEPKNPDRRPVGIHFRWLEIDAL